MKCSPSAIRMRRIPLFEYTVSATLTKCLNIFLDSHSCFLSFALNESPYCERLTCCHGDPDVHGIDVHRLGRPSQPSICPMS